MDTALNFVTVPKLPGFGTRAAAGTPLELRCAAAPKRTNKYFGGVAPVAQYGLDLIGGHGASNRPPARLHLNGRTQMAEIGC